MCSSLCPYLSHIDWCLQSDARFMSAGPLENCAPGERGQRRGMEDPAHRMEGGEHADEEPGPRVGGPGRHRQRRRGPGSPREAQARRGRARSAPPRGCRAQIKQWGESEPFSLAPPPLASYVSLALSGVGSFSRSLSLALSRSAMFPGVRSGRSCRRHHVPLTFPLPPFYFSFWFAAHHSLFLVASCVISSISASHSSLRSRRKM